MKPWSFPSQLLRLVRSCLNSRWTSLVMACAVSQVSPLFPSLLSVMVFTNRNRKPTGTNTYCGAQSPEVCSPSYTARSQYGWADSKTDPCGQWIWVDSELRSVIVSWGALNKLLSPQALLPLREVQMYVSRDLRKSERNYIENSVYFIYFDTGLQFSFSRVDTLKANGDWFCERPNTERKVSKSNWPLSTFIFGKLYSFNTLLCLAMFTLLLWIYLRMFLMSFDR